MVQWDWPTGLTPNRGLVAEIKEILYAQAVAPAEGWRQPALIKTWSETALSRGWRNVGGVGFTR